MKRTKVLFSDLLYLHVLGVRCGSISVGQKERAIHFANLMFLGSAYA